MSFYKNKKFYAFTSVCLLLVSTSFFALSPLIFDETIENLTYQISDYQKYQYAALDNIKNSEREQAFAVNIRDTCRILRSLGNIELSSDRCEFATKIMKISTLMAISAIECTSDSWIQQISPSKNMSERNSIRRKKIAGIEDYDKLFKLRKSYVTEAVKGIDKLEHRTFTLERKLSHRKKYRRTWWTISIIIQALGLMAGLGVTLIEKK